jgi:glycosyltransferase involved in cell wall biosynthesis
LQPAVDIVHLISSGGLYGAERVMLELAAYSKARGLSVHVLALDGRGIPDLRAACAAATLPFGSLDIAGNHAFALRREMRRKLEQLNPRVVHTHNYKPTLLLASMPRGRTGRCRVSTCHNWLSDTWRSRLWETLDKRVLRTFDQVVAVSADIRSQLEAAGVEADRVTMIRNGIDFSAVELDDVARRDLRVSLGFVDRLPLLVQIGRLDSYKGCDTLLQAVASLGETIGVQIAFVGDGPSRTSLEALARRLRLDSRVRFLGFRSDVAALLQAADGMVLASHREGSPMVVLEAMATQRPMILTTVGEIPSMFCGSNAAWLVPAKAAEPLARAVAELVGDTAAASGRAAAASKLYLADYSRDAMGRRYHEVYRKLGILGAGQTD